MRCKPLPAPCIATRQPPLLQRLQRRSGRAARTCSCARFFSRRCAGASSRKLAFSEAPLQRHIASHLSSTAVAPEDLNYPECLTGTQSSEQAHAAISSDAPPAACSPAHVFPVIAASLAFLRRVELALETPVFEKLVRYCSALVPPAISIHNSVFRSCRRRVPTFPPRKLQSAREVEKFTAFCSPAARCCSCVRRRRCCPRALRSVTVPCGRQRLWLQGIDAAPCVPQASVDFRCHAACPFDSLP